MTRPVQTNERRIPVVVLGGFLGSGKTTLLNRLLGSERWARSAVVINEFGLVSLDHLLVQSVAGDRVVLKNGCVCCTIRTDLQSALRALLDDPETRDKGGFERILIETTGLADPGPIAQTLASDPMLRQQTRLATIACTVDAVHGPHQIGAHAECLRQIAAADHLLITKTDIGDPSVVRALKHQLASLNPIAAIIDVAVAREALEHVVEASMRVDLAGLGASSSGLHCEPVHVPRDARWSHTDVSSVTIESEMSLDWTAFAVWLSAFVHAYADQVLRIKGILFVHGSGQPIALHVVRNHIHPPTHFDVADGMARISRIVFIVKGLDTSALRRSLLDFVAPAANDPDAEAQIRRDLDGIPHRDRHPPTTEQLGGTLQ